MSPKTNNPASSSSARWVLIGVSFLAIVGLSVYLVLRASEKNLNSVNEAKKVRTTTAVVKAKEFVKFDEKNHSYIGNLDDPIEVEPGTERWRIYYQIENFNQVPETKRSELWESEEARIKKFGLRFHSFGPSEKESYDRTQIVLLRYVHSDSRFSFGHNAALGTAEQ